LAHGRLVKPQARKPQRLKARRRSLRKLQTVPLIFSISNFARALRCKSRGAKQALLRLTD
jgi:hypothetical protein